MTENIHAYLLSCIPPRCVCTRTNKGLESMYFSHQENNLSDDPILHVRDAAIINLKAIKTCVKEMNIEIRHRENEWMIYKPKKQEYNSFQSS